MSLPPPRWFLAKSAESLEKKRVEFCVCAKKRKRVRKGVKRKNLNTGASDWWRVTSSPRPASRRTRMGIVGTHPGSFRPVEPFGMQKSHKTGKQRRCGIRNLEEDTEDGSVGGRARKEKNIWLEGCNPAVFVRADSKGVTGVTVCKCEE